MASLALVNIPRKTFAAQARHAAQKPKTGQKKHKANQPLAT